MVASLTNLLTMNQAEMAFTGPSSGLRCITGIVHYYLCIAIGPGLDYPVAL